MRKSFFLGILLVTLGAPFAQAEALRSYKVAGWTVSAYTFERTDRFSHCAASVPHNTGASLFFAVDRDYKWRLGFSSSKWNLSTGSYVKLGLSIDGMRQTIVTGIAKSQHTTIVELATTSEVVNLFRRGRLLKLAAADQVQQFRLDGSSAVIASLIDCVRASLAPAVALSPLQPPAVSAPPPEAAPARTAPQTSQAEATALLANVLSIAGIQNFRVRPGKPKDVQWSDAGWSADGVSGYLIIVPEAKTPKESIPEVLKLGAQGCKRAFLSGALPANDESTARIFTKCETGGDTATTFYLLARRPKGGLYVFVTASTGSEDPAKEADASIRTAALTILPK